MSDDLLTRPARLLGHFAICLTSALTTAFLPVSSLFFASYSSVLVGVPVHAASAGSWFSNPLLISLLVIARILLFKFYPTHSLVHRSFSHSFNCLGTYFYAIRTEVFNRSKRQTAAFWLLTALTLQSLLVISASLSLVLPEIYGYMDGRWTEDQARTGPVRPPRPSRSFDYIGPNPAVSPQPPSDLTSTHKTRKSSSNVRGPSQLQNQLSPGFSPSFRYSGATSATGATGETGGSERKKSFRKAVRKLFGRKAKDESMTTSAPRSSFPGHGHHRSVSRHGKMRVCNQADRTKDPGQLMRAQVGVPQPLRQNPPLPLSPRTFSVPPQIPESPSLRGLRSPNAMSFSKSSQLKPLELGNPFYHRPGPKRRATLPTLNLANRESGPIGTAIGSPPDSGMGGMGPDLHFGIPTSQIGLAVTSTPMNEKRRSRSANDLRHVVGPQQPKRKRSEEIRFWRESFSGTVLLNPNTPPEAPRETDMDDMDDMDPKLDDESVTPHIESANPLALERSITPTAQSDGKASSAVFGAPRNTIVGVERTEDLERRVANLESSLQEFQRSLEQLTMTSRSNTISPGPRPHQFRRQHTPSVLIDTLQNPSWRPESLNEFAESREYEDAGEVMEREWGGSNRHSRTFNPGDTQLPPRPRTAGAADENLDPGAFTALYNMFNDERSARHRLETEVRTLQREVTTMATRLERGSWNSYSAPPLPVLPAQHRPRTPDESVRGASRGEGMQAPAYDPRIVSRFSGSDSLGGESEIYGMAYGRHGRTESGDESRRSRQSRQSAGTWLNYRPRSQGGRFGYAIDGDADMF